MAKERGHSLEALFVVKLTPEDVSVLNKAVKTGKVKSWDEYIGKAVGDALREDKIIEKLNKRVQKRKV